MKKKDKLVLGIGLVAMVLTIIIGTSYAYWKLSKVQEDRNIIATGCFNVEFTDGDGINLQNAFPISDEDGLKLTPYTFTIKNTCDDWAAYQINLETLEQATGVKVLPDEYVRVDLQEGTSRKTNSTLTSDIEAETTLTNATKAYKLYEGMLRAQEEKTYNLRIWMDKDVQAVNDAMNAFYSGKVTIEMSYRTNAMKNAGTLRYTWLSDKTAFYSYRSDITKVVFQNELNPIETELTWDVSSANNGSVMSYLVPNEEDNTKYTLYLQGDGGIYANPNSSYLFYNFTNLTTIEGLEYFDTSQVTGMSDMFRSCTKLESLDLSNFDTSKVTDMTYMFKECKNLTSLDLSDFNTSNVTNMSAMFRSCTKLESLDLSNFDTLRVTNMSEMFGNCSSLTSLDVSNFNTSNVTVMGGNKYLDSQGRVTYNYLGMFEGCRSLIGLDVSHFDTSKVTNMNSMFYGCSRLTNLSLSNFDTSKVTNIAYMFNDAKGLSTTITIKSNNIDNYQGIFWNSASLSGSQIIVNYTEETSGVVDQMIATKSDNSNVVKGDLIS